MGSCLFQVTLVLVKFRGVLYTIQQKAAKVNSCPEEVMRETPVMKAGMDLHKKFTCMDKIPI